MHHRKSFNAVKVKLIVSFFKVCTLLFKRKKKKTLLKYLVTLKSLRKLLKRTGLFVVDFWAKWCFPCLIYARSFKKVGKYIAAEPKIGK